MGKETYLYYRTSDWILAKENVYPKHMLSLTQINLSLKLVGKHVNNI